MPVNATTASVQIKRVTDDRDRRAFLEFPYSLYQNDPMWTPPIWADQLGWLNRAHGFFEHADADWFLARQGGRVVGTIGLAIDHRANQHLDRRWGIFGFLEFVEDPAVLDTLIQAAQAWFGLRGVDHCLGPRSFTPNDYPGFLVGRFDLPPALYEGHSPPYYARYAEAAGWETHTETLAYRIDRSAYGDQLQDMPPKIRRVAARVARNPRYRVRHADLSEFDREFEIILGLYNRALSTLDEFVPMTAEELRALAETLRPILDEEMVLFAMVDGKEVGFSLALPNLAEPLRKCNGLRRPWNYLQLWWGLRNLKSGSGKILATDPDYWGLGLEALLFDRLADVIVARGYEWMDASLTGSENPHTHKLIKKLGFEEYKRYRTYVLEVQ